MQRKKSLCKPNMHLVIDRSGVVGVFFLAATIVLMSIATLWPDAANAQRMGDSNADRPMVPRPQGLDIYDNSGSGSESLSDSSEQPTGSGLTREEIIEIQQLLNEYDFSAGAADGIFGPKSSAAIKTFQTSIGLEVNGQLSLLLLQKLRSLRNASFRLNTNLRNTKTRALDGVSEPTIPKRVATDHLALSRPAAISKGVINVDDVDSAVGTLIGKAPVKLQSSKWVQVFDNEFFGSRVIEKPWRITGKGFEPHWRQGIRTARSSGLLEKVFRKTIAPIIGVSWSSSKAGVLYAEREFSDAFQLKIGFRSEDDHGQLRIGPYRGSSRKDGYRVLYSPSLENDISVVWIENGRVEHIIDFNYPMALNDGMLHELIWIKRSNGSMSISIDGFELFSQIDIRPDVAYDGLVIEAQEGVFSISYVKLKARPEPERLMSDR